MNYLINYESIIKLEDWKVSDKDLVINSSSPFFLDFQLLLSILFLKIADQVDAKAEKGVNIQY